MTASKMKILASFMCAAMVLCAAFSVTCSVQSYVDSEKTGSVTIELEYGGSAVTGGGFAIYRVADATYIDGSYSSDGSVYEAGGYYFSLTEDFLDCGLDEIISEFDEETAQLLFDYVISKGISAEDAVSNVSGIVVFDGLSVGLYLVASTGAAEGYSEVSPFLVSIPMYEDGEYVYDVNAYGKFSLLETQTETSSETETSTSTTTKLAQTGQLNWPVPVLAFLGASLFVYGFLKNRKNEENTQGEENTQ